MSFIVVQPGNDELSTRNTEKLLDSGVCDYDTSPQGLRLRVISSGMKKCTEGKSLFYNFVDGKDPLALCLNANEAILVCPPRVFYF